MTSRTNMSVQHRSLLQFCNAACLFRVDGKKADGLNENANSLSDLRCTAVLYRMYQCIGR